MVIILYSAETGKSIQANMGVPEYSYYFVLKKFRKILCDFAHIVEVKNPETEVDVIYKKCRLRGEPCLFFSFSPPHKTVVGLKCPTISVFAWEYLTIPTETWNNDPRNDWRYVLHQQGCAITHSNFAVRAVREAMGSHFPIWSIPAPVWDDYSKLYRKERIPAQSGGFDLTFEGGLIDFQGCDVPDTSKEVGCGFIEQRSSFEKNTSVSVSLKGIIYATVLNPDDGRKNWLDLIRGFVLAFREVEDVTLIIKLVYYDFDIVRLMVINEIKKLAPFKCRVVALQGYLNDDEYAKLTREVTYVVNTAYGEGQCLPLMEYMSAGKPAVAPAHTAMEDYINEDDAFIVKSSVEITHWPHDPRSQFRTLRYRIDWESLYNAYLESYRIAQNDPVRYAIMSEGAVESLRKYCSDDIVREQLKNVFHALIATERNMKTSISERVWQRVLRLYDHFK